MHKQFDAATRVGAVTLAALRMFQASPYEARVPYADILDAGGIHEKPLSASAVDAICEAMAHGGALVIDTEAQARGTRALYPDETAGGARVPAMIPASDAQRTRALELYDHGDDLELDDVANTSQGDGGTWVAAWVWLPDDDQDGVVPEPARTFAHQPEACPSNHWNGGDDICADCGEDLA